MDWNVKEGFCADGESFSTFEPMRFTFTPSVKIDADRRLTAEQKRRVIDALVKTASVEMVHIAEEVK